MRGKERYLSGVMTLKCQTQDVESVSVLNIALARFDINGE